MFLQYYTSRFRYDSVAHWAQKRSRLERLKALVKALDDASVEWPQEEVDQYQDAVLDVASRLCSSDENTAPDHSQTYEEVIHLLNDGPQ